MTEARLLRGFRGGGRPSAASARRLFGRSRRRSDVQAEVARLSRADRKRVTASADGLRISEHQDPARPCERRRCFVDSGDPSRFLEDARVAFPAELLAKLVIERQGAIRALMSVSIARGTARAVRPGYRFALINQALAPLSGHKPGIDAATLEQLRRDLAIVISAEAVLTLTDLYGLDSDAAVASIVHTARLITEATLARA
jgi:hypothetical protein